MIREQWNAAKHLWKKTEDDVSTTETRRRRRRLRQRNRRITALLVIFILTVLTTGGILLAACLSTDVYQSEEEFITYANQVFQRKGPFVVDCFRVITSQKFS